MPGAFFAIISSRRLGKIQGDGLIGAQDIVLGIHNLDSHIVVARCGSMDATCVDASNAGYGGVATIGIEDGRANQSIALAIILLHQINHDGAVSGDAASGIQLPLLVRCTTPVIL